MPKYDYDLYVIGAGSGGVRASRMAALKGARVAIAEEYRVGGTCVIRGCIPKKLFVYASHFAEEFEDAAGFGWEVPRARFSWPRLIENKDKEIDRLNGLYIRNLELAGVTIDEGRAVLEDAHTVQVGGRRVTAETILIATGASPHLPGIPGIEHAITSNEAFHLEELPRHVTVVGGGYIAVEFAGIFHGLGVDVTELYRGPEILRGFDDDLRAGLAQAMRRKGVDLRVETNVEEIEKTGSRMRLSLTTGETLDTDLVMYATGRWPNTRDMGLEAAGVRVNEKGAVAVDEYSRSSVENIFAIGDVTDRLNLTPVAIREGMAFAETVYGGNPTPVDHEDVASAVFSQPAIGTVGLTETQARERYGELDIYKSTFRALKNTLSGNPETTLMKLVVDRKTERVVGVHMLGADAAELIQGIAIAVKMKATKRDFDRTVAVHPTAGEEFVTMTEKWAPPEAKAAE